MLLGIPVFWLFYLPHYLYFLSILLFAIVVQSVVLLLRTQQKVMWVQILFFGLATTIAMYFALG
jgi:hypothetical protein